MKYGILLTALPFDSEQISRIEKGFEKNFNEEVRFRVSVDEGLIGGFIAKIDGILYDASFHGQLESVGRFLKE